MLALLVQVNVCDVVSIERNIFLSHRIRVQSLVHPVGTAALGHLASATALSLWLLPLFKGHSLDRSSGC